MSTNGEPSQEHHQDTVATVIFAELVQSLGGGVVRKVLSMGEENLAAGNEDIGATTDSGLAQLTISKTKVSFRYHDEGPFGLPHATVYEILDLYDPPQTTTQT